MLPYKKIVITGGAGFVGSNLALLLKLAAPNTQVIALDNLYRRGSEFALPRLKSGGCQFVHGDIRCKEDLEVLQPFDLMIECSAEPSVRAGYGSDPSYLLNTNLLGTLHCLEAARKAKADFVFLSTSRVYSIQGLQQLPLKVLGKRFVLEGTGPGWSAKGIQTDFSIQGTRSLYGSTKLASELIIQEYGAMYGLNAVINRCGVIAGPWQMGKVDQGFISLWLARHLFRVPLKYMGFGGKGHQVRDVLHIEDLYRLLLLQLKEISKHRGKVYNVGGGLENSISLAELTEWCGKWRGSMEMEAGPAAHPADIPYYVTDNTEVMQSCGWSQKHSMGDILGDVGQWLEENRSMLTDQFTMI